MYDLDTYKAMLQGKNTIGQAHKINSDMTMESSWDRDIESRVAYFYDYYHDDEKTKLKNLKPSKSKVPIDIKFMKQAKQTFDKDVVTVHIQFKPSFNYKKLKDMLYYKDVFEDRYHSVFPVGLYCDIPDEKGIYNKWLVVGKANYEVNQFPTFEVLPCDKVIQYIYNNKKYQLASVLRSQNSYNSGIWQAYRFGTVEDQQKFIVPLNRDTENIYYNLRMILDAEVVSEPRCWVVSKVNRTNSTGVAIVTMAQDKFDQHKDFIELDDKGNVIGQWADYYTHDIAPTEPDEPHIEQLIYSEIECSGVAPQLKVGGSYKTLTVNYYEEGSLIEMDNYGDWQFYIDDIPIDESLIIVKTKTDISTLENNQIKIKFLGDDDYLGKIIEVKNINGDIMSSLQVEIVGM